MTNKKNESLSPIIVFTYNRPVHLKKTIESLNKSILSKDSDLIIFSDGKKNKDDFGVDSVRDYINNISGFKSIKVYKNENNNGLANQIINGVSKVIKKYKKVIVLEDDIIVSKYFLKYMNDSLRIYENNKKVWHISGWNYPIRSGYSNKSFFTRKMNCWGWGTWDDRWNNFSNNSKYISKKVEEKGVEKFNFNGLENNWSQTVDNIDNKIRTWAIFWYASIFINDGLCLSPVISLTKNIGNDELGTNCKNISDLNLIQYELSNNQIDYFPKKYTESTKYLKLINNFMSLNNFFNKNNGQVSYLKNEISGLKNEVNKLSNLNIELDSKLKHIESKYVYKLFMKLKNFKKILKVFFINLLRRKVIKKNKYDKKSKKLVYIGHSYHSKTGSTSFLIDYLKDFFELTIIEDESWKNGKKKDLSFIDESYLGVIFFQNIYSPEEINKIKNGNIIFFPMYDSHGPADYSFWYQYKDVKIINFSETLHKKLLKFGLNSIFIKYFPKPKKFSTGKYRKFYFWQRISRININTIISLIGRSDNSELVLHRAIDPEQEFIHPSRKQMSKYKISISDWYDSKSEMDKEIDSCSIYFAPREYEGIGLSFLEAMASGKAVVAVNNPTMNEYIINNKTGYLYDLNSLLEINFDNYLEIQKNSYNFISKGYIGWNKNKKKIINYIKK